ncbi:hypothetical protein D516_3752 [Rhodobacter sp. AKP1]|nr:hypothetical protein D516_3752 [Rhodobacter sp. AKP1]
MHHSIPWPPREGVVRLWTFATVRGIGYLFVNNCAVVDNSF